MRKLVYGLLVVIAGAALYMVLKPQPVQVQVAVLRRGDFVESFRLEGKVRSRNKITVFASATGDIQGLKVKLGDLVKKGQVVTWLDWDWLMPVKSPIDGVISKVFRDSAGPVTRGAAIFEVSQLTDLEVVAELLTPDAMRLSPRGEVHVLNWGGEGVLAAHISKISRAGEVKISALGVEEEKTEVRLSFERIPPELKDKLGDNYHVDVEFIISKEREALAVPLGALFKAGDDWVVYVMEDGRARSRKIQISKRNDREALVTAGLRESESVILFPGDDVREGVQVRASGL